MKRNRMTFRSHLCRPYKEMALRSLVWETINITLICCPTQTERKQKQLTSLSRKKDYKMFCLQHLHSGVYLIFKLAYESLHDFEQREGLDGLPQHSVTLPLFNNWLFHQEFDQKPIISGLGGYLDFGRIWKKQKRLELFDYLESVWLSALLASELWICKDHDNVFLLSYWHAQLLRIAFDKLLKNENFKFTQLINYFQGTQKSSKYWL